MLKCECGSILSDGITIKSITVIQLSRDKTLCNVRCKRCKRWLVAIPFEDLITEEQHGNSAVEKLSHGD
jgi:hypothetical protein